MLRRVAHARTDVSAKCSAFTNRVKRFGEVGTALAVSNNRRKLRIVFLRSVRLLLVTAYVVPTTPILVTLMIEVLRSPESSVLTRTTRRNIPEDILHSHRRENLKSYILTIANTVKPRSTIPESTIFRIHR
jgi:hypothetical protein